MRITTKGAVMLLVVFLFSSLVSAEILMGQTKSVYNVGDEFKITMTLTASKFTSDFFIATLICKEGGEIELFKSPYTIKEGEKKEVVIETALGNFLVGEKSGRCFLKTSYGTDQANSQTFEIVSNVDVSLNIDGTAFDPGDSVKVFGKAVKTNGESLEGYVELTVSNIDFSISGPVTTGKFELNFTIPENAFSGTYEIKAKAYEKDNAGEIMNQGTGTNTIKIKQLMKEIDIAFDKETVSPGSELIYTVIVYDQAGETVETDASLVFLTPEKTISKKALVKTNKASPFKTESNSTPGYWKIKAKAGDLETTKTFLVEEFESLSFSLEDQILIVTNTGNVPYTKPFEVSIGGVNEVKEIKNLPVGASKKFKLVAPDGSYDIEINDGSSRQALGSTFLTGKAVSVEDIGGALSQNLIILISLIIILVIAITGLYIYRKVSKSRKEERIPDKTAVKSTKTTALTKTKDQNINIIDKGEKQESEIISLKIKNSEILSKDSPALKVLDSALWKATESGAKVYTDGDFRIIVFTQTLTKQKDNSMLAISTAQTIERMLKEHNKRAAKKIEFGIGVNQGNLIVETKGGKFRFISTDNSIAISKRISQEADSQLLISESLHRKTVGRIKVTKLKDKNLWKVEKITDRTQHEDFIKKFTAKQKAEAQKK